MFQNFFLTVAHAATPLPPTTVNTNIWDAVINGSPVVQFTLLILIGLSILCWSVIFSKRKQFQNLLIINASFSDFFWKTNSLEAIYDDLHLYYKSSVARLFKAAYLERQKIIASPHFRNAAENSAHGETPRLLELDSIERVLRKTMDNEITELESKLSILATTGSTGPFIGLFGTVWGIMTSFQNIGATGSASLAVVAPGIAEALVATAIGLAAAIPAVIAYNHFISKLKKEELSLNSFSSDFLNILKHSFSKGE